MNPRRFRVPILVSILAIFLGASQARGEPEAIAPPAADETLIYVIREARFSGGGVKVWIAVNDQTVARVENGDYAVVRAKAGVITLNLAAQGIVLAAAALDDRPGKSVYLKWRVGDQGLTELTEEEAQKLLRDGKLMEALDAPLPNNEQMAALINLSRMGLNLMRPATRKLAPDGENAVITVFRSREAEKVDLGVWSENGFVGTLGSEQAIEIKVPAGDHWFLAGNLGTSLLRADIEAGKRYYVWLDFGKMIGRVRLTPITREQSRELEAWLSGATWVEIDPATMTDQVRRREETVASFIRSKSGNADAGQLGAAHAYEP